VTWFEPAWNAEGKKMRTALSCLALLAIAATFSLAQEPSATAVICSAIVNNSCEHPATKFPTSVGKVFGFSQVSNVPDKIVHVWYYKARELGRVNLPVRAVHWKCWSSVSLDRTMVGPWRLEVLDGTGKMLASADFTVVQ
jgi:hypothetical protein